MVSGVGLKILVALIYPDILEGLDLPECLLRGFSTGGGELLLLLANGCCSGSAGMGVGDKGFLAQGF